MFWFFLGFCGGGGVSGLDCGVIWLVSGIVSSILAIITLLYKHIVFLCRKICILRHYKREKACIFDLFFVWFVFVFCLALLVFGLGGWVWVGKKPTTLVLYRINVWLVKKKTILKKAWGMEKNASQFLSNTPKKSPPIFNTPPIQQKQPPTPS